MPKLERSQWYDLYRDMNWNFKYVTEEEVVIVQGGNPLR
jgi:toluene monooxygenase system protein A